MSVMMNEEQNAQNNANHNNSDVDEEDDEDDDDDEEESTTAATMTRPLHVVFCHLDLGIGGAEQLILQLATASQKSGHKLDICTTRCDPYHCFAAVKPGGSLYSHLHVWGQWIPTHLFGGKAKAACSTIRLLFLAWKIARKRSPDVIVLDVLPLPLLIWQWTSSAALLFYCHFPDKLLLQQQQQQQKAKPDQKQEQQSEEQKLGGKSPSSALRRLYRKVLDGLEESSMRYADVIAVNSNFTRTVVRETFPALQQEQLPVLYPALDTASLATSGNKLSSTLSSDSSSNREYMIVSLNRFERKKQLELVLEAVAWLRDHRQAATSTTTTTQSFQLPRIVIAGGYDTKNTENVEYYKELETLATQLDLSTAVEFKRSVSDTERAVLLQTAMAVLYTPTNEHFGIVPLEAMYAQAIVIANRSGGPMETVDDGVTGFLCNEPTAEQWGRVLQKVLLEMDETERQSMGAAAKKRVETKFSQERLQHEWCNLLDETVQKGKARAGRNRMKPKTYLYIFEAIISLLLYWLIGSCAKLVWCILMLVLSKFGRTIGLEDSHTEL